MACNVYVFNKIVQGHLIFAHHQWICIIHTYIHTLTQTHKRRARENPAKHLHTHTCLHSCSRHLHTQALHILHIHSWVSAVRTKCCLSPSFPGSGSRSRPCRRHRYRRDFYNILFFLCGFISLVFISTFRKWRRNNNKILTKKNQQICSTEENC